MLSDRYRDLYTTESIFNEALDKLLLELAAEEKANKEKELQRAKENAQYKQQLEQAETRRKQELTIKYGAATTEKIIAGKLEIGMTKAVCKEIVGYATVAEKTATTETWKVVSYWTGNITFLFFTGDKLERIVNR